jgi:isopentenyl diphosphate isomerase/L-lactate dehydrogenase-like FMN-dependent dehydrogenase
MSPINVADYEALAEQRLSPFAWAYYSTGSDDEVTLRENRAAYARIRLRPRMLVNVSDVRCSTTLLGTPVSMPIGVAPTAAHGLAHPEGECATARGAGTAGTLMVAATESSRALGEIAAAATGPLWLQLYVFHSRDLAESLVRRAEAAGFRAIVLTVDLPVNSHRERVMRCPDLWPNEIVAANLTQYSEINPNVDEHVFLTWQDIAWLRSITSLPLILKGILTAEDARLAVEHGVDGVVVSNHGGRALDSVPATIEALPEVVEAVAGRCEVYLDGGVRRGTDVLKALALGARAVFVGRPVLYGLAVGGEQGAGHVLELLRDELALAMTLAGVPTLGDITRSLVHLP